MPSLAIDALDTTINPAAIKAAGYIGVLHYLRNLTPARVADLHAAGLNVGTIFETLANESLGGASAGTRDGQLAASQMTALGQPHNTLHVVNVADFAPSAPLLPIIQQYYTAYKAQTADWYVLPYGTGYVLNNLTVGWQNAMDDNGVSGSIVVNNAAMYQRIQPTLHIPNASYDENVIIHPVNWWTPTPQPSPGVHVPSNPLPATVKVVSVSCSWNTNPLRLDVVMVGSDGNCYHKWWIGGQGWNGPDVLNGKV